MKSIKENLKKIDAFAVPFSFKYKSRDKYGTIGGGISVLLFCVLVLVFGIYYFIPFIERKNFTIVYYTMNIPKTEQIKLKESRATFAVGINCEKSNSRFTADDILKLDTSFIVYNKNKNGTYNKVITNLKNHACNYADFYNSYNDSVDYLNLKIYRCLFDYDQTLQGIYADQIFSYYEFTLLSKENTPENLKKVDEFLFETDCKLQIVYTDITIDLENHKEPMKDFLNSFFIQISPILFIKRNIYFMNQYLYNDDNVFWVFRDEDPDELKTLFSRYEEYSLYLGFNRSITNPPNRDKYAKIYMRADTRKTDIKRRYQKLMEFYADASSLLIGLYEILIIIFGFINTFYAEYSISNKLFLFKDIEGTHFDISKNIPRIKRLLSLSWERKKRNSYIYPEENTKEFENVKESNVDEILIYNNKNSNNQQNINKTSILKLGNENKGKIKKSTKIHNINKEDSQNVQIKSIELDLKSSHEKQLEAKEKKPNEEIKEEQKIIYSFNVLEMLNILLFSCCMRKKLKIKNDLNEKAINILNNKLDIVLYIRNMLLFDIINETILDDSKKSIINFLCRPILSIDKKEDTKFSEFYRNYKEKDFDSFILNISKLIKKYPKEEREKKLTSLCYKQLEILV